MNCQRFESVASELARNQIMEADVRSEALAHSAKCGNCLARLRNEEMLTRGLRALATEMISSEAPAARECFPTTAGCCSYACDAGPSFLLACSCGRSFVHYL